MQEARGAHVDSARAKRGSHVEQTPPVIMESENIHLSDFSGQGLC